MRNPFSDAPQPEHKITLHVSPKLPGMTVMAELEGVIAILKREFRDAHPDWRDVFKHCVRIELKT